MNSPGSTMRQYPVGKLPQHILERMLRDYTREGPRVLVGPRVGEDATVIDFGDRLLVAKTDPITFAADRIGWYAVNICANDIATMGATPLWFLAAILLPEEKANQEMVEDIFQDLHSSCTALGIALCGGHTEITYGLDRPIVVGHMLGEVERDKLVTSSGARSGDAVLLTKGVAIEGTAVLALEKGAECMGKLPDEVIRRARDFLSDPGISVLEDARTLCEVCHPTAMHDPTEGGLATALWELATASGVGLLIDGDSVRFLPETREFCQFFRLDPWGLLASGALLATVDESEAARAVERLCDAGIPCVRIGTVKERDHGLRLSRHGELVPWPHFDADEITKVL